MPPVPQSSAIVATERPPGTGPVGGRGAEAPGGETPKYEFETLLAEGAEGRVYVVTDRDLERRVAMKVMQPGTSEDMRRLQRFLNEARRTASLAHAAIPAVHDLGYVATGEMFFTMRLVEGRTLREVFEDLTAGNPEVVHEWTLVRIVQVLQQVAAAVDYAHCQGILHRDLKPENIAVSSFQEVLVLDWGLSKKIGRDPEARDAAPETNPFATQLGAVKGTPLYMAPEQARGAIDVLDARADVFSLGAILYEALCHEPPYDGATVAEILMNAKYGRIVPLASRPLGKGLPRALVDTCMRALSPDPAGRHEDAKVFADDLQGFLEGTKEREFRAREASGLVAEARKLVEHARRLIHEASEADHAASDLRKNLPRWAPESEKERLWKSEDAAARARVEAADTHARATDLASRALALDERHVEARALLAGLYLDRFLDAERRGHAEEAAWLRRMVERYDDGDVGLHLQQRASVTVESDPPGAEVVLARVVERGRRRVESDAHVLGPAPRSERDLVPGDWAVRLRGQGRVTVRVPLRLGRGENRTLKVRIPRPAAVPPGFVVVPGGPFVSGVAADMVEAEVGDFAVMELPVRLADYALWLDELAQGGADEAQPHLPWVDSHGVLLRAENGRHVFAPSAPSARRPFTPDPELPVVGISRSSAEAYGEWLGRKLGVVLRLPTEREWEKAARGTDGRTYPWGDHFDPTFCSMADSTPGEPNLRPAGAFAADVGPYGVRDMAGGVREWCRDRVDEGRELAVCRGGAWYLRSRECAVTSRWIVDAETRNPGIGFRLCCEIPSS